MRHRVTTRPLTLLLAAVSLSLAACGEDSEDSASKQPAREKAEKAKPASKAGPELCLLRGGTSNVEKRDKDLWRGFLDEGGLLIVHKFGSASEAKRAAQAATDIESEAAGRYAVNGTLKGGGSAEAVGIVADCLRSG